MAMAVNQMKSRNRMRQAEDVDELTEDEESGSEYDGDGMLDTLLAWVTLSLLARLSACCSNSYIHSCC